MRIWFKTSKLARTFNSVDVLRKAFGPEQARKIALRVKTLEAAPRLSDVPTLPPDRCHELKGDRRGQFAVDLVQPYRLIFAPKTTVPKGKGGKIDPAGVAEIVILGVEDYHGD